MNISSARLALGLVVIVVGIGAYAWFTLTSQTSPASEPTRVRWLLVHEPSDVYVRAIEAFQKQLSEESGGTLVLETVTPSQLGLTNPSRDQIMQLLVDGTIELSTVYGVANGFSDERFWVWQMPFLLDDYAAMESAFASSRGEALLEGLSEKTPVRALAYALSGGFRIIASPRAIDSLKDLKGLRIATVGGPVAEALWTSVGAIPVSVGSDNGSIDEKDIDAVETTYARLAIAVGSHSEYARRIAETNHSLFLSTIVVSDAFYDSLTPDQQRALTNAARTAAAIERADAIKLNESTKSELGAGGTTIAQFSASDRDAFMAAAKSVYNSFPAVASPDIVNELRGISAQ